jgi:segregation and condensation protein B
MQLEQLKQVVEVLIFASDIPLPVDQVRSTVEDATVEEIVRAVDLLNVDYRQTDRTFQIVHVAGGYQMVTHENYTAWVRKLFAGRLKQKLSQAAMETLSVIAFRQPVGKPDIEAIRGVNCDGVIRTLLERKLITLSGRDDGPGRALLYKTTREFLRYFGVNDISDLPKPKELDEMFKDEGVQQNLLAELTDPPAPGAPTAEAAAPEGGEPGAEGSFAAEGGDPANTDDPGDETGGPSGGDAGGAADAVEAGTPGEAAPAGAGAAPEGDEETSSAEPDAAE